MAKSFGLPVKPVVNTQATSRGSGISIPTYKNRPKFGISNTAYPKSTSKLAYPSFKSFFK